MRGSTSAKLFSPAPTQLSNGGNVGALSTRCHNTHQLSLYDCTRVGDYRSSYSIESRQPPFPPHAVTPCARLGWAIYSTPLHSLVLCSSQVCLTPHSILHPYRSTSSSKFLFRLSVRTLTLCSQHYTSPVRTGCPSSLLHHLSPSHPISTPVSPPHSHPTLKMASHPRILTSAPTSPRGIQEQGSTSMGEGG